LWTVKKKHECKFELGLRGWVQYGRDGGDGKVMVGMGTVIVGITTKLWECGGIGTK